MKLKTIHSKLQYEPRDRIYYKIYCGRRDSLVTDNLKPWEEMRKETKLSNLYTMCLTFCNRAFHTVYDYET